MLQGRGGPGDRERALKLLDEALDIFQDIGKALVERNQSAEEPVKVRMGLQPARWCTLMQAASWSAPE